ncbi:hypothetical protein KAU32_09405 [bacterium]|nr:hypothetical protein [bacterium]
MKERFAIRRKIITPFEKVISGIVSIVFLYMIFIAYINIAYISGTKLQRSRSGLYKELEAGKAFKSLPEEWGEPELVVNFTDGTKIYYFAGVHASEGGLQEIKDSIGGKAITYSREIDLGAYAYIEIYVDKDGIIEAYSFCGEEVAVHTIHGDIEGGALAYYLRSKYLDIMPRE